MLDGYVPLRRGIRPHLPRLKGAPLSVYTALLTEADYRHGSPTFGCVNHWTVGDLCRLTGYSDKPVRSALLFLAEPVANDDPDSAYITYEPAVNADTPARIRIHRFRI